ncbi:hypothetical protein BABINDRAFT_120181 [Babjeviella inositovora NRRL Y-12698]|uniref:Uncharacterized protein n=1 Tax=Babjeviella inositovora NRRL Y-12698 TaxID=984486 RepID=A0A1E3QTW8_9ASCO|nr:uncharacterized protein BABINDRAFT_120181 [Babjeviella inositovora NRRL Y-12698]ODQ81110.1 hypothetical protein BABINDRAFT_120181 [Babjeviella inositovora NRRL Y-12698]
MPHAEACGRLGRWSRRPAKLRRRRRRTTSHPDHMLTSRETASTAIYWSIWDKIRLTKTRGLGDSGRRKCP